MMWQGTVEVVNYTRGHCFLDCTGSVDTWRFRRWLQEFCHFLPLFLSSPVPTLPSVLGRFHCSNCKSEDDVPFKCPLCDFTCCKTCWEQFLKVLLFIGLVFSKTAGEFCAFQENDVNKPGIRILPFPERTPKCWWKIYHLFHYFPWFAMWLEADLCPDLGFLHLCIFLSCLHVFSGLKLQKQQAMESTWKTVLFFLLF